MTFNTHIVHVAVCIEGVRTHHLVGKVLRYHLDKNLLRKQI